MGLRVYITGATGYIGGVLARRLVAEGHEVHALVRPRSDIASLEADGVVTSEGDITDRYSLRPGMAGADWVIHAAANTDLGASPDLLRRVNVEGTENVASLAFKLGIGRFLHVSSMARWGGSPDDGTPATEETPPRGAFPDLYGATKAGAEEAVRAWRQKGLAANVVSPSLVYGPPGKATGTNALLARLAAGEMPVLVGADRKLSWVHVEDLVDGILRVMTRAEPGRDYLLTGDVRTLGAVADLVCRQAGTKPPPRLPLPLARVGLTLQAAWARLRGRQPTLTPDHLAPLAHHWAFDDSRARRELGWTRRGVGEGLAGEAQRA